MQTFPSHGNGLSFLEFPSGWCQRLVNDLTDRSEMSSEENLYCDAFFLLCPCPRIIIRAYTEVLCDIVPREAQA